MSVQPDKEITRAFNILFAKNMRTIIVGGFAEPLYLPPHKCAPGVIRYTQDYAASALHEIAHWCIAGQQRRRLIDYGYRYVPPPRSAPEQQSFFRAEARVQALESIFAEAAGVPFHLSADEMSDSVSMRAGGELDSSGFSFPAFARRVDAYVASWKNLGLSQRADEMFRALSRAT